MTVFFFWTSCKVWKFCIDVELTDDKWIVSDQRSGAFGGEKRHVTVRRLESAHSAGKILLEEIETAHRCQNARQSLSLRTEIRTQPCSCQRLGEGQFFSLCPSCRLGKF